MTGSSLLTLEDSSSLLGERGRFRLSFAPFGLFLRGRGEFGLDATPGSSGSTRWGIELVALPGTSSCRALYKSRISLTDAETRRLSNRAAVPFGSTSL